MRVRRAICGVLVWLSSVGALSGPVGAAPWETTPKELENLDVAEHVGESLPLELVFRDHRRQDGRVQDWFEGRRPVIVSMNYSNCPMLCNLQLSGLVESLKQLDWTAGKEFDVVSVSMDPSETPERAGQTRQRYLDLYERAGTGNGWRFLVGNRQSIERLAASIGFKFRYVPDRKEYAHPAMFVLCTPDGKIARYMYGVDFPPETLRLSLVEAGEGKVGGTWERILLFCFHYDAEKGRYAPAARNLMRTGGVATVVVIAAFVAWLLRRERRMRSPKTGPGPVGPVPV